MPISISVSHCGSVTCITTFPSPNPELEYAWDFDNTSNQWKGISRLCGFGIDDNLFKGLICVLKFFRLGTIPVTVIIDEK
jgi:hypothetical protein